MDFIRQSSFLNHQSSPSAIDFSSCSLHPYPVLDANAPQLQADLRAAAKGDGSAYARIIESYQDLLAKRMTRFSRDPVVIEELVHDAFVQAYFSLPRYRGDAPFEHFLQCIATRVGYRYWKRRKKSRNESVPLETDIADPSPKDDSGYLTERLMKIIDTLTPRDRLAITLLYVESRSVAEAAQLAGWSQTMMKVQAFRARGKLKKLIESSSDPDLKALL